MFSGEDMQMEVFGFSIACSLRMQEMGVDFSWENREETATSNSLSVD